MKFIIKFEKGTMEQTYKLSEIDMLDGINDVFKILDEEFIATVVKRFEQMRADFGSAYSRHEF